MVPARRTRRWRIGASGATIGTMTPTQRYSLSRHPGPYADWPATTPLLEHGRLTGARVPGYCLEAQYDTPLGVLLITSYDCPFEESNAFLLLGDGHVELARTELLVPYGSMLLEAHGPIDARTLGLYYHGGVCMTLQLLPPRWPWRPRPRLRLSRRRGDPRQGARTADC